MGYKIMYGYIKWSFHLSKIYHQICCLVKSKGNHQLFSESELGHQLFSQSLITILTNTVSTLNHVRTLFVASLHPSFRIKLMQK